MEHGQDRASQAAAARLVKLATDKLQAVGVWPRPVLVHVHQKRIRWGPAGLEQLVQHGHEVLVLCGSGGLEGGDCMQQLRADVAVARRVDLVRGDQSTHALRVPAQRRLPQGLLRCQ